MIKLLIFILVAYGASNIMVYGSIFAKFRNLVGVNDENPGFFGKLFGCMMCLPFWWGVILSLFMFSPTEAFELNDLGVFNLFTIPKEVLATFFDACLASGSVYAFNVLVEYFEN